MIQERDDVVALDSAIIQHPRTWEASGHLAGFTDPLVDCRPASSASAPTTCRGERGSAAAQPSKHPGEDAASATSPRRATFNLMFETTIGPVKDAGSTVYLRPETAQGIFLDFKTTLQYARKKPPFGIAQVGKSFRNEITPGNFIFRTLEFEQMEMEFFVPPDRGRAVARALDAGAHGLVRVAGHRPRAPAPARARRRRALALLVGDQRHRVPVPDRLVRARGHRQPRRLRPHPARGVLRREARVLRPADRRALRPARDRAGRRRRAHACSRCSATPTTRTRSAARQRTVLRLHPARRAGQGRRAAAAAQGRPPRAGARDLRVELRTRVIAEYDEGGAIGKRYRRQDEIGTPFAVTVDHQSLEDRTVTLRDRDTLAQERVPVAELVERSSTAP